MTPKMDKDPALLSAASGRALLRLARSTIARKLGMPLTPDPGECDSLSETEALQEKCGTFVTLKRQGELRGCIGSLVACESIVDGIRSNAINAAFCDSRFPPLTREELPEVVLEISILSEPEPLTYADAEDLLRKLRPGHDGVVIRKGALGATFLPQVWEQLPRPEDFLSHLCSKARLPAGSWRQGDLEVSTYTVQHFEEKPGETDR